MAKTKTSAAKAVQGKTKKAAVKTAKAKTAVKKPVKAKAKAAPKTKKAADKARPGTAKSVKAKPAVKAAKKPVAAKAVKAKAVKAKAAVAVAAAAPVKLVSVRKAYGEALVEAGKKNKDIVVLEADLGRATMSYRFKENFPDRFFEMGIAEQNMTSAAAGFALAGKIPFTGTFAVFAAGRAYDQMRCSIAIPKANVKIIGSSCGFSDYGDGKTHQSVEDSNVMRAMPYMTVLTPCDAEEAKKMVHAIIKHKGPVYLRINRKELPVFTSPKGEYQIGKMYPMTEGKDVVIFASGVMVSKSVEAAAKLKAKGISVQVVNVSTLKPLHKKEVLKYAAGKKAIITAEESVRTGGLGETIAAIIYGEVKAKFEMVAIDDVFGRSAHNYEDLLVKYGLSADHVYKAVIKALKKK
jgi:transketolase